MVHQIIVMPVRILPPIETTGMTTDDIPGLMARYHQQMAETIATL